MRVLVITQWIKGLERSCDEAGSFGGKKVYSSYSTFEIWEGGQTQRDMINFPIWHPFTLKWNIALNVITAMRPGLQFLSNRYALCSISNGSVKEGSSQDESDLAIFFHFENNAIGREGLRVLRDSFAYKEYGIRLMLAPRSAKALHEKVLLKLHGIRKLPGSPSLGGTLF
nr:hypothetical protein [Tanacetum cinerariifolium]GEX05018.1 hypothetical protein [Tanacetum cinerariifolium]